MAEAHESDMTDELVMQRLLDNIDFVMDTIRPEREDLEEVSLAVASYKQFIETLLLKKELKS